MDKIEKKDNYANGCKSI